eukprot:2689015-Amphidinium_carterae.4
MAALRQLKDEKLTFKLQSHMELTSKFMTKLDKQDLGTPGSRAGVPSNPPVPPVVPTIVHQTQQEVAVTINPGPAWKTTEFDEAEVLLVGDDETMKRDVPALQLTENTWTSTSRIAGVVKGNPLKAGVPGSRAGTPEFYVDYLQAKGIASDSSFRYPTRSWFQSHFILPEIHGLRLTQVTIYRQSLEREGVDFETKSVNLVEGISLKVGVEGTARRASLLRKYDPTRFEDEKWNGSPTCLTIDRAEFLEQFLYMHDGKYKGMSEEEKSK